LPIHTGKRLLEPAELQLGYQTIIDTEIEKDPIEHNLAALTAGERIPWARARRQYFSSGINKTSLHIIEKAAFCVILDDDNAEVCLFLDVNP
jgi:carnitine O-palmitoyltransferase 1